MSARRERLWRGLAVLAAFVYLVAMFAPWSSFCYERKSWPGALASTATKACGGWGSVFGITSIALCYLILVFALLGPRRSALSLEPLRAVLTLGLVALTVLEIYSRLGFNKASANESGLISRFSDYGQIGYGAWVALGSSLALLLAFSVLGAGGLSKLLDRLPAWARLDRLEEPEEAKKANPVVSSDELSHRRWTQLLVFALIAYLLSLFANWWYSSPEGRETRIVVSLFSDRTMHFGGLEGIGEFCALAALATLFTAYLARQGKDQLLERVRNALLGFLIVLTLVNVPVVARVAHDDFSISIAHIRPDWGALAALLSILLMLLATLVLNAGGWAKLLDQLPAQARLGRLDEPPRQREETT